MSGETECSRRVVRGPMHGRENESGVGRFMRIKHIFQLVWFPVSILVLWEALAWWGILNPLFFPPPSRLVSAAARMMRTGELAREVGATFSRFWLGLMIGAVTGLAAGVLMGVSPIIRRMLEPVVSALYTTPKISLLPMVMLVAGVGDVARVLIIALGCFIMLAIHTHDGVRGVDPHYLEVARNYGANRRTILRRVYIPASLPQIFTGFRLSAGRALMITIAVEMISCPDGLGSMIFLSWQTFATEKLYIGVFVAAGLGALFHHSLRRLERVVVPWKSN